MFFKTSLSSWPIEFQNQQAEPLRSVDFCSVDGRTHPNYFWIHGFKSQWVLTWREFVIIYIKNLLTTQAAGPPAGPARLATWLRLRLPVSLPCRWVVYSEELGSSQPSEPSPWRESDKVKSEHLPCDKIYTFHFLISLVEMHYLAKKLMTFLLRWDYWRVQRRWFCFSYPSPKRG